MLSDGNYFSFVMIIKLQCNEIYMILLNTICHPGVATNHGSNMALLQMSNTFLLCKYFTNNSCIITLVWFVCFRYGFNSCGLSVLQERLKARKNIQSELTKGK